jgi:hypothetical protein
MVQGVTQMTVKKWTLGIIAIGASAALAVSLWTIQVSLFQLFK